MKTEWIPINERLTSPREIKIGGVRCKITHSPYDVPLAVRGFMEPDSRNFVIELKYLTEEPVVEKAPDEFTKIEVGQKSNRIYKIKLNAEAIGKALLATAAEKAITEITPPAPDRRVSDCYSLTKNVISQRQDVLFGGLPSNRIPSLTADLLKKRHG